MKYVLASLLIVLPCFWNGRVQASDLASHTYNIWLADLIRAGQLPGLFLVDIHTNVLFDWIEEAAIHAFGYEYGEKVSIALAVLTFFWGAFAWIRAVTKSNAWPVAPLIAMFTYGWVFHMGFANFFLAMGLALFALTLFVTNRRLAWLPLIPAAVAHMIPVAWAVGLILYAIAFERFAKRVHLLLGGIALIAAASAAIATMFRTHWHVSQVLGTFGVNQLWLFADWYGLFAVGVLFFLALAITRGAGLGTIETHFYILSAAIALFVPWVIHLPWYTGPLSFITHRMSLAVAIPMLAVIARAGLTKPERVAALALALAYFVAVYRDTTFVDNVETALRTSVHKVPRDARVVASMPEMTAQIYPFVHLVDRACIGHCFSYGNYEPATAQFRVRHRGPNPYVAHTTSMSLDLQTGIHTVTPADAPLYMFVWTGNGFKLRILQPGDRMSD